MSLKYRPEIDGIRALAVLLVIFYHAQLGMAGGQLFPGGYIGVDVFFVISGYLITSIIYREIGGGTFSLMRFYERRARRILPALFIVLLSSSLVAWFVLLPEEFVSYGESLLATTVFGANIYFWKYTGLYSAAHSSELPLLHMWSLAVEEQFYVLFPPFFWVMSLFVKRHAKIILIGLGFASLALAEWASFYAYSANFYLMPTRAWELLAGSVMAVSTRPSNPTGNRVLGNCCSIGGIASILLFALLADETTRHPSLVTTIPVAGTMALIWFSHKDNPATRFLSFPPIVYVGLISYSLYLWHQPVFAFFRIYYSRGPTAGEAVMLGGVIIGLSLLSYYLVERITRSRVRTSNKRVWQLAVVGSVVLIAAGSAVVIEDGYKSRFPVLDKMLTSIARSQVANHWQMRFNKTPIVFPGNPEGKYTLVTMGDSHVGTLGPPIHDNLEQMKYVSGFVPMSESGKIVVEGVSFKSPDPKWDAVSYELLDVFNKKRVQEVLKHKNPIVIIAERLTISLGEGRFNNTEGGVEPGTDVVHPYRLAYRASTESKDEMVPMSDEEVAERYRETFKNFLDNGFKIVLVYPIPEVGWNVPQKIMQLVRRDGIRTLESTPLTTSYEVYKKRVSRAYAIYDSIPDDPGLLRVYPEELFCEGDRCVTHDQNELYYRDDDHLSYVGASMLFNVIKDKIEARWVEQ